MRRTKGRIAVVVVHGMGNQFPMDTLRGFADALKPEGEIEYSSPNRITDDTETRRLSFRHEKYDFFEYYWAPYVDAPGFTETILWSFKLLFFKKPSKSLSKHIVTVRVFAGLFILLLAGIGFGVYQLVKMGEGHFFTTTFIGALMVALIKTAWELLSKTIAGTITKSVGDVIKYTVPSPDNIAARDTIRKHGIELLKNLHEAKDGNENFKYGEIIVVAHSLGTIVSYDILSSLFAEYNDKYSDIPDTIKQDMLEEVKEQSVNPSKNYQQLQEELFDEYRKLGSEWRVSHFITMGSPLTHAAMLVVRSEEEFEKKKDQREYPTSPPKFDENDKNFAFDHLFKREGKPPRDIKILHHAAYFAETKWTNIYFENDWVGGNLSEQFGKGIKDIPLKANGNLVSGIPLLSHTKYWDKSQVESVDLLKGIFDLLPKEDVIENDEAK
jgi:hypothetical protein